MADLATLERALRNADAAGDVDAAKVFAAEIIKLRQPKEDTGMRGGKIDALITGMRDPVDAGAQLLPRALAGITSGFGIAPNAVSKFFDEQAKGVDTLVSQNEDEYQSARIAQGRDGFDAMRMAGNVASPANVAVGTRAASLVPAATTTGRVGQGIVAGGAMGALSPVTEGNFWDEKAKQIASGSIGGAIAAPISSALSRVIQPKVRPEVKTLLDEGVTPTPGQIMGGMAQRAEDGLTSMPILGDAIRGAQRRAQVDLNSATWNRVLKPLGLQLPKDMKAGNEVVEYVGQKVSDAYDDLLPKLTGRLDAEFKNELSTLKSMAMNMPKAERKQFYNILKNEVTDRFTSSGLAMGETLKNIESKLGEMVRGYSRSSDYDKRVLGDAIKETQASLRRMLERNNQPFKGELQAINKAYANLLRAENAAGRVGAKEGVFSAAQLRSAVRQLDPSKNKRQFARGNALMQDLADAGESVLGKTVPDSGTPFRLMNAAALGGGYWLHPWIPAAEMATTLPYTQMGSKAMAALLAKRPELAKPVADAVEKFGYLGAPGLMPLAQPIAGLLD